MINETQTLMLGDVDIGQYVEIPNIADQRLENVKAKVKELKNNCLSSEIEIYNELCSEMISRDYPRIDLSFLEKSSQLKRDIAERIIKYKLPDLPTLPVFSVYPFYGSNKFSLELRSNNHTPNSSNEIPEIIKSKIFKNCRYFGCITRSDGFQYFDEHRYIFTSEFKGLIPQRVKEKVKRSLEHFNKNDIYLIAETKPEEWNVTSIRKGDPLVIGLIENKYAHLIDHFDCTPLENLVKDIYPKEKLN